MENSSSSCVSRTLSIPSCIPGPGKLAQATHPLWLKKCRAQTLQQRVGGTSFPLPFTTPQLLKALQLHMQCLKEMQQMVFSGMHVNISDILNNKRACFKPSSLFQYNTKVKITPAHFQAAGCHPAWIGGQKMARPFKTCPSLLKPEPSVCFQC